MSRVTRFPVYLMLALIVAFSALGGSASLNDPVLSEPSLDGTLMEDDVALPSVEVVTQPEYQILGDVLAEQSGFLGLVPAMDDSQVLHAFFEGDAPDFAFLPVPDGWTLELHGHADLAPMVHELDELVPIGPAPTTTGLPPNPADFQGIRPGSLILVQHQGDSRTFICTIAFIMEDLDTGRYYASTAGHCVLPQGATATHGPGADWDPALTTVAVCVNNCFFGGQLSFFNSDFRVLGEVKYARQQGGADPPFCSAGQVGNDFGLVEIFPIWYSSVFDDVTPRMAMWDGPVGSVPSEGTGIPLVHYGNGIDTGSAFLTKGRAGLSLNDGIFCSWQAALQINGGDSGSPISHAALHFNTDVLRGDLALGVVTHGIGIFGVIIPGLGFGTVLDWGIMMAADDADLNVALVTADSTLNQPPTASFSHACTGLACSFDASASSDPDGTVVSHEWDFGDGNAVTTTNPLVDHTYGASGTYTVTLHVRDNDGAISDPTTAAITVDNLDPTASFTFSCTDLECAFDASASSDPDGTIVSYDWDFGDSNTGTGVTTDHVYATGGSYDVTLTVTDNAGGSDSDTQTVTLTDPGPGQGNGKGKAKGH